MRINEHQKYNNMARIAFLGLRIRRCQGTFALYRKKRIHSGRTGYGSNVLEG